MADFDFSTIPGLFSGMDQDQLRALMAAYMPSEEDKRSSRGQAAMMAAFAAMANPYKGQEMQALGNAGMAGLASYRQGLRDITSERGSALTQAAGTQKLLHDNQTAALISQVLARRMGRPVPGAEGFTPGGTAASAMTGGGGAPMPSGGGTPGSGSGTGGSVDSDANDELALALAGKGPAAEALWRNREIKVTANGDIYRGASLVGRTTPAGTVWFQADGSQKFVPTSPEALKATAEQAGAVKGAEKAAENRYTIVNANVRGVPTSGYARDVYGDPDAGGAAPAPAAAARPTQPSAAPAAGGLPAGASIATTRDGIPAAMDRTTLTR